MSHNNIHANIKLDMRGLSCPAPLLGAKRIVNDLDDEQILLLLSDCPGTKDDLFSWAEQTENQVLKTETMADGGTGFGMPGQRPVIHALFDFVAARLLIG